jgi:hypothetical protein
MSAPPADPCNPKPAEEGKKALEECKKQPEKRKRTNKTCADLAKEMNDLVNGERTSPGSGTKGLKDRIAEQEKAVEHAEKGLPPPPCPPGTYVWYTHQKAILEQQRGLRQRLDEFTDPNRNPPCDQQKVPNEILDYVDKPLPEPKTVNAPVAPKTNLAPLGWIVGGGAALYIAYRVVRFLPSLAPPLWPTIPANLAVP